MSTLMDETVIIAATLPCHLVDPDIFFAEAPAEIEYAKTLCVECPVRGECLAGALTRREACGVWGGELVVNGLIVEQKRPRGRPRKDPVAIVPRPPANLKGPIKPARSARPVDGRSAA